MTYEDKLSALNEKWSQVAPKTFLLYDADPSVSQKVKDFYFRAGSKETSESGGNNKATQHRQQIGWDDLESLTNAYSDRYFFGCTHDAAVLHAKHAPVHLYFYTYKPDIGFGYVQETARGLLPVRLELIIGYFKFHLYRELLKWNINDYGMYNYAQTNNNFCIQCQSFSSCWRKCYKIYCNVLLGRKKTYPKKEKCHVTYVNQ